MNKYDLHAIMDESIVEFKGHEFEDFQYNILEL